MSDKLSETILFFPGVITAAVKHDWADKARLLAQQVEEWELEAKRLYGVGQDIEEMRVALEAKLKLMAEAPKMYEALEIIAHNLIPNGSKAQMHNQLSYAIGVAVQAIAEIESTQEN